MTDPTIITPDNLPEIGEMVECVDNLNEGCHLAIGKHYSVITNEGRCVEVENDAGAIRFYGQFLFRRLPENVKPKEPMKELTILVDDELLIEPLVKLLNKSKITPVCNAARNTDIIRIDRESAVYFSDENSKQRCKNYFPLSNWKEVRRRIEELVKPESMKFEHWCGSVDIREDMVLFRGLREHFPVTKSELQTILEQMK